MRHLFKFLNQNKPKLREFDPATTQRIKEGAYVIKLISEAEIAARKCNFYANNATDSEISQFLKEQVTVLTASKKLLQDYYKSMTKE